jgi:hypothetical protein
MKDDQRVKSFVCEREDFVLHSIINFEPVKRFKNRRIVMKFRSFGDSVSSSIYNKFQTLSLSRREGCTGAQLRFRPDIRPFFTIRPYSASAGYHCRIVGRIYFYTQVVTSIQY